MISLLIWFTLSCVCLYYVFFIDDGYERKDKKWEPIFFYDISEKDENECHMEITVSDEDEYETTIDLDDKTEWQTIDTTLKTWEAILGIVIVLATIGYYIKMQTNNSLVAGISAVVYLILTIIIQCNRDE